MEKWSKFWGPRHLGGGILSVLVTLWLGWASKRDWAIKWGDVGGVGSEKTK